MRFSPFFLVALFLKPAFSAPLPALEGTLTQTQNGVAARAKIVWTPPDTLRIDVEPNDAAGIPAQTILASGDQTLLYDSATKRVRHANYNLAKNWWRGSNLISGGPANFLFAGTPFSGQTTPNRVFRRDDVLLGGSGQSVYYAAIKSATTRFPAQITVSPNSRLEKDEKGRVLLDATVVSKAGLPQSAQANAGGEKSNFLYDLKPAAAPATETATPFETTILEDDELEAPSFYSGNSASETFNRGAALAQNEDFSAAFAAFERAAQLSPQSSAPHLAAFDLALSIRDDSRAQNELQKIGTLGLSALEIESRRARLSLLRRDWSGAFAALDKASSAAPQNAEITLRLADLRRTNADISGARVLWRALISSETALPAFQAVAAQNLALYATPNEFSGLIASVSGSNDAAKLARSLLLLRSGASPETAAFSDDEMQIALALGLERAARDDDAKKAWDTLQNRGALRARNRASAHLMTLAAKRGDLTASLAAWHDWDAALGTNLQRDNARGAFLDAWQKAFRSDTLRDALGNRAAATNATPEDLRLFLSYQQRYGNQSDIDAAIETGANRFPDAAFWNGRRAEVLIAQANQTRGTDAGIARREQLYSQAMALLDRAIQNAPDEPFYRFQKALAAAQRGAKMGGIIDAAIASRNRALAKRETEALLAGLPGDPDALVCAALQNLAYEGDAPAREAIRLATLALDSAPIDGDRHSLVWAARQALSSGYRRLKQPREAAAQWDLLVLGARDATEEGTLAASYFAFLEKENDIPGVAALLTRLAHEKWDYSASRALLDGMATRVALSPLAPQISKALLATPDDGARLSAASLEAKRVESARRALNVPEAPPIADANLDRAVRDLSLALGQLPGIAASVGQGHDPVLSARAAAYLSENASLDGEKRLALLRQALGTEPGDAALRFALVGALNGEEAKKELDLAARCLDFEPETRRQLAGEARRAGDAAGALAIAEEAANASLRAPDSNPNGYQRLAFMLARSAFDAKQTSRSLEIYSGLQTPQWNPIDRAAAYFSQSRAYQDAGRAEEAASLTEQVRALGLSQTEIDAALAFIDEVEN